MGRIDRFEDLEVWKISRELCQLVEHLFQTTELGNNYALRNQMERSSGSIMDNVAEGFGRGGNKEFHNFLSFFKRFVYRVEISILSFFRQEANL